MALGNTTFLADSSFPQEAWRKQSNWPGMLHTVTLSIWPDLALTAQKRLVLPQENAAIACDELSAPSAVWFGHTWGCVLSNSFKLCSAPFLSSLCCDKVGNKHSHKAFSGWFRTQGKADTSIKTLFQNLFIQLLFSNIQYSL